VPVSQDYTGRPALARWVLPDEANAIKGNMFDAMWPAAMAKDSFLVPMIKNGRAVADFWVSLDGDGRWTSGLGSGSNLPGGDVYDLERATLMLEKELGPGTRVRPVVFLPSGFAFAVGDNRGREAAVFLYWERVGPGVTNDGGWTAEPGDLLTQDQLLESYSQTR